MTQVPCTVAILAGGMGTRLKSRTGNLPKPMAPVCGKPVLEHLISLCETHGFRDIAFLVHHEHEVISDYFGDGSRWGVKLTYCIEHEARGTAGALKDALPVMADRFLVLYGDTYADVDLSRIWNRHNEKGGAATLFLHPNDHPADSDIVALDCDGNVNSIHPYPHDSGLALRNLVNAALYVFQKSGIEDVLPVSGKADIARHTLTALLGKGRRVAGYVSPEYIKDMGTPDRLDKVERDISQGIAARLSGREPRTAIFLDRDGTINVEVSHLKSPEQLALIPGAGSAIRSINRSGNLAVVVTNQPVLARGDVDWRGMDAINARLDQLLGDEGAYLDRLYLCPHHPDKGFAGEIASLKQVCGCRKPATGLIDQAVTDLEISRRQSWIIGDSTADIVAGQRAGLRTILLETGHAGGDHKHPCTPDFVMSDIGAAVSWILTGHDDLARQMLPIVGALNKPRLIAIGGLARSGKTNAAKVMSELFRAAGQTAHVVSLDGWLYPVGLRNAAPNVLDRYDLGSFHKDVIDVMSLEHAYSIPVHRYDRRTKTAELIGHKRIDANDVLIVEGVVAHLDNSLMDVADTTIFVEIDEEERNRRLAIDYHLRGVDQKNFASLMSQRLNDEVPLILGAKSKSAHIVTSELVP
jgi:histidinol-phosphate phosphatase family protein